MKKDYTEIIFKALCSVMLVLAGFLLCTLIKNVTGTRPTHYCLIKPTVFDALTGEPIKNAVVTDTYDGNKYVSDEAGSTDWLAVYYDEDTKLTLSTFVIRAAGYKTTVMYAVTETGGSPLDGPMIYLFSGDENQTVSMVYSPSDEYSEDLIKKFAHNASPLK